MGLAQFVGSVVGDHASASIFIPVVLFAVAVFLSFSTGTSWGTFAILVPIATGMFAAGTNLEMMIISVSAVLAGAVCGDHISPISDTTVMSSAGAQSNHLNHVSTQMQYAAVTACVCLVGYLIAAVTRTWWITLGVSLFFFGCFNRNAQIAQKKRKTAKNKKKTEKRVKCLTGEEKEPYTKK